MQKVTVGSARSGSGFAKSYATRRTLTFPRELAICEAKSQERVQVRSSAATCCKCPRLHSPAMHLKDVDGSEGWQLGAGRSSHFVALAYWGPWLEAAHVL